MIKNLVTVSLIVFLLVSVGILGASIFVKQDDAENNKLPVATLPQSSIATITINQVAQHNSRNDCWMIISGKVYSLANYMTAHPGGASTIIPLCGKDGTSAFATQGGQGSHSQTARNLLVKYYVGDLAK
ncbi:MAG: cytochrome b5-like heme/steroid binding domain-containing protein [Candidatus Staskawiczbacteria bacterium]|jgi:cytochrome b involved in lipid metabolism